MKLILYTTGEVCDRDNVVYVGHVKHVIVVNPKTSPDHGHLENKQGNDK